MRASIPPVRAACWRRISRSARSPMANAGRFRQCCAPRRIAPGWAVSAIGTFRSRARSPTPRITATPAACWNTTSPRHTWSASLSEAGAKVRSRDVPARHGWLWIRDGFRLFVRAPLMCWVAIALWCLLYLLLRGVLSVVGELLFAAIYPALSAGFMLGCQAIERGEELEFAHIVAGFRQPRAQLLKLGAITLALCPRPGALASLRAPPERGTLNARAQ